jgi:hypothetical protein
MCYFGEKMASEVTSENLNQTGEEHPPETEDNQGKKQGKK